MNMENNLIVNFTPTGMIPTKGMTPHVPMSISEIIEDVHRVNELGVTMVHLHARDAISGKPTYEKEIYAEIIQGIRKYAPMLVVCVSLSGRDFSELEKRSDAIFLEESAKPDMGSLTLSSLNFNKTASINSPQMVKDLAKVMKDHDVVPELEVFDSGMINYAKYLESKKLIQPPHYFNLLFGNIACAQANILHAGVMINDLPNNSLWSIAGIGDSQLRMNSLAIAMGGGVRVGLEDNIWYDKNRSRLATNFELVQRIHTIAESNERDIMAPGEFRTKMNLLPGNGNYGRIYDH